MKTLLRFFFSLHVGPQLKCIGTMSVGYDHIDIAECRARNIPVGFTPDVLTNATAELTVGLLLAASRRLIEGMPVKPTCPTKYTQKVVLI